MIHESFIVRYSCSFNLTLLECKCLLLKRLQMRTSKVLILPYWNVNRLQKLQPLHNQKVLILPYWNVNSEIIQMVTGTPMF